MWNKKKNSPLFNLTRRDCPVSKVKIFWNGASKLVFLFLRVLSLIPFFYHQTMMFLTLLQFITKFITRRYILLHFILEIQRKNSKSQQAVLHRTNNQLSPENWLKTWIRVIAKLTFPSIFLFWRSRFPASLRKKGRYSFTIFQTLKQVAELR